MFALSATAYMAKYGLAEEEMRRALSSIEYKNHFNSSLSPKAMFRKPVPFDKILNSPYIAYPLTLFDCSGVSDGCACAIVCRTEDAPKYRKDPMYVKALQIVGGPAHSEKHQSYDFTTIVENQRAAEAAYAEAGITDPASQISLAEVHDCFSITELLLYEDLGFSKRGEGWKDVMAGNYNHDGKLPVNISGGLKSFGHPIGATGIRMLYEIWLQFHGRAGERQRENMKLGLTHNMGGTPYSCVAGVTIVGSELG